MFFSFTYTFSIFFYFYFFTFDSIFGYFFIFTFLFYLLKSFKDSSSEEINSVELKSLFSTLSFKNPFKYGLLIIIFSIIITLFGAQLTVSSAIKSQNTKYF